MDNNQSFQYTYDAARQAEVEKIRKKYVPHQEDKMEQLRRLQKRNPEMLPMFQNRWIPLEKTYFEAYDIRRNADCVIESPCSEDK